MPVVAHFRLIVGGPRKILKNQFLVTATDALLTIDPDAQTRVLYRTSSAQGRCSPDDAFRTAMQKAIDAGEEKTPTVVSKKPAPEIRRA